MSDDQQSTEEPVENDVAGLRKVLKELGEDRARLQQENATLKREQAFGEAGVPRGDEGSIWDLFRKSYDGELTADAIKAGVDRLGIPQPEAPAEPAQVQAPAQEPPASQQPDVSIQEMAAMQDMASVRTQFSAPATDNDPLVQAMLNASGPDELNRIAAQHGFLAQDD